jgi:hypothetical protein
VVLLLLIRGPVDWSRAFAFLWYGLFGVSVVLGLIGAAAAFAQPSARSRVTTIALSLPARLAIPVFLYVLSVVVPLAN